MNNEREILNKTITDTQAALDKAIADLANLDKPIFRFGDYGTATKNIDNKKINIIYKQYESGSETSFPWNSDEECFSDDELSNIQIFGNCIDDMKRNQADLKEFEISGQYDKTDHKTLICRQSNNDMINIYIHTGSSNFTLDQAIEIYQKLGQVIATKQRSLKSK